MKNNVRLRVMKSNEDNAESATCYNHETKQVKVQRGEVGNQECIQCALHPERLVQQLNPRACVADFDDTLSRDTYGG